MLQFLQIDWTTIVYGNTVGRWTTALGFALAAVVVVSIVKRTLLRRLETLGNRGEGRWDHAFIAVLGATSYPIVVPLAVHLGTRFLDLPNRIDRTLEGVAIAAVWLQVGLWLGALIKGRLNGGTREAQFSVLSLVLRSFAWGAVVLMALSNLGVNVSAAIAGLGVGGIAVALAVQNILGDLLASLSILLDKPFVVGDYIVVDDYQGTVEHIGIKTTRVRSQTGEQLVFSNGDLLKARLRNYKRMHERRALFTILVPHATPIAKLTAIPPMIRALVEAQPLTRFDRAHLKKLGDSLEFEVVYWLLEPDYKSYLDTQQALNLALLENFAREGIEFAQSSTTLVMQSPAPAVALH